MSRLLTFPNPVNETSARIVAAGVVALGGLFLATGSGWVLAVLTYGFAARVLSGPTLSPLGWLATRVVTPRLAGPHRLVPGPPKRFAQGIGLLVSGGATLGLVVGMSWLSNALIGALVIAATLESAFAVCLGCILHRRLWGCDDCDDLATRWAGNHVPSPTAAGALPGGQR